MQAYLLDLQFLLTSLLGFPGFLRIDELLSVKTKHLKINESHLEILVLKSKIDKRREEPIAYISRVSSRNSEISKYSKRFLIGRIFKTNKRHKIL